MDGYYEFTLASLRRLPHRLAALVHETLDLISRCLVPALLPADMWRGEPDYWYVEVGQEEFRFVRELIRRVGLQGAAEHIEQEPLDIFNGSPEDLQHQLARFHRMLYCRPAWMRVTGDRHPISRARRLARAAQQYEREFGEHPWATFSQYACQSLLARFPDDARWQNHSRHKKRASQDLRDCDVPLEYGLWVNTQSECEEFSAERIFPDLGHNGEQPTRNLRLDRLATSHLKQILEALALGLGLFLRAEAIDEQQLSRRRHGPLSTPEA